mmetsp:Transcript_22987/g.67744  ORF Transcript_22987/g.67744 Transcript_22987/m.67744 type:complete len:200 (-) Transcript_22987:2710-3309(-)
MEKKGACRVARLPRRQHKSGPRRVHGWQVRPCPLQPRQGRDAARRAAHNPSGPIAAGDERGDGAHRARHCRLPLWGGTAGRYGELRLPQLSQPERHLRGHEQKVRGDGGGDRRQDRPLRARSNPRGLRPHLRPAQHAAAAKRDVLPLPAAGPALLLPRCTPHARASQVRSLALHGRGACARAEGRWQAPCHRGALHALR